MPDSGIVGFQERDRRLGHGEPGLCTKPCHAARCGHRQSLAQYLLIGVRTECHEHTSLRHQVAGSHSGLHPHSHRHAGTGHRRQHVDVQHPQWVHAAPGALCRPRSPGPHLSRHSPGFARRFLAGRLPRSEARDGRLRRNCHLCRFRCEPLRTRQTGRDGDGPPHLRQSFLHPWRHTRAWPQLPSRRRDPGQPPRPRHLSPLLAEPLRGRRSRHRPYGPRRRRTVRDRRRDARHVQRLAAPELGRRLPSPGSERKGDPRPQLHQAPPRRASLRHPHPHPGRSLRRRFRPPARSRLSRRQRREHLAHRRDRRQLHQQG